MVSVHVSYEMSKASRSKFLSKAERCRMMLYLIQVLFVPPSTATVNVKWRNARKSYNSSCFGEGLPLSLSRSTPLFFRHFSQTPWNSFSMPFSI